MPASRSRTGSTSVHVGVRPEKIQLAAAGEAPAGRNCLDGVVTDTSFIGVSTQYLVRMPWGQELMVFAQNIGSGLLAAGTNVSLHWDPAHTFALDAAEDVEAGRDEDVIAAASAGAA